MEMTIREPAMFSTKTDADLDAANPGQGQTLPVDERKAQDSQDSLSESSTSQDLASSAQFQSSPQTPLTIRKDSSTKMAAMSPQLSNSRTGSGNGGFFSALTHSPQRPSLEYKQSLKKGPTHSPMRAPGTPNAWPYSLDSSMISIKSPGLPVESRSINEFVLSERLPNTTFHFIRHATVKNPDGTTSSKIFKENEPGSYLSELEATIAACYRLIAPNHVPETRAVYREKDGAAVYCGVVSDEIPGFKSISVEPLKEEDLDVADLAERNLFSVLDDFDDELRLYEKNNASRIAELKNRLKELDDSDREQAGEEEVLQAKLQQLYATGADSTEVDALSQQFILSSQHKNNLFKERCSVIKELNQPYDKLLKEHNVSKLKFERYRKVKGLAIGLTTSYIFVEEDLHKNNFDNNGMRIDFDMSLWPISFEFKKAGYLDLELALRSPRKNILDISEYDIIHFPNIRDATPHYWPTHAANLASSAKNAYTPEMNAVFQKLETNPVFVYHKFATMLKFCLTNADMYRHIAMLHMRKDCRTQSKSLIDVISQFQAQRIQSLKDKLLKVPEFSAFMTKHGETVFKRIMKDFSAQNESFVQEVEKIENELEEMRDRSEALSDMNDSLLAKSTDNLEEAVKPFQLPELVEDYNKELSASLALNLQHAKDERRLQFDVMNKNEEDLKKLAVDIPRKEAKAAIYRRQRIDVDYMESMYKNICGRIENGAVESEQKQASPGLSRPNSLSNSASNLSRPASLSLSGTLPPPLAASLSSSNLGKPPIVPTTSLAATASAAVSSLQSLFSFNFGLSKAPVIAPPAPKPNDYLAVKALVIEALNQYQRRLGGYTSSKASLAEARQLLHYCNATNDPELPAVDVGIITKAINNPSDEAANADAIANLKARLLTSKTLLKTGAMFDKLTELLNNEIWKINEAKVEGNVNRPPSPVH
jgi:hypothetical protein